MIFHIYHSEVQRNIQSCYDELILIHNELKKISSTHHLTKILTNYAIMRSCGVIEHSFKTIIFDSNVNQGSIAFQNYVEKHFRQGSTNPDYAKICESLGKFDDNWQTFFKNKVKEMINKQQMQDSLNSLVRQRNSFAHGGNPSASFQDVVKYFLSAIIFLELLEKTVAHQQRYRVIGNWHKHVNYCRKANIIHWNINNLIIVDFN